MFLISNRNGCVIWGKRSAIIMTGKIRLTQGKNFIYFIFYFTHHELQFEKKLKNRVRWSHMTKLGRKWVKKNLHINVKSIAWYVLAHSGWNAYTWLNIAFKGCFLEIHMYIIDILLFYNLALIITWWVFNSCSCQSWHCIRVLSYYSLEVSVFSDRDVLGYMRKCKK